MSELPSGWTEANLLDICQPKQWKVVSAADLTDSGYVVYGANGKIGFYSTYTHENPTLMITCRGATCGNLHISEPRAYINGNAMALDDLAEQVTSIGYLKYALQARGLTDAITGSAQPQITKQSLSEVTLRLAPLAEQTLIAQKLYELLAQVDTLKARIGAIPGLLKRFRQSVLTAAISGQLTEEWRKKNQSIGTGETVIKNDQLAKLALLEKLPELKKKKSSIQSEIDENYLFEIPENWCFTTWGKISEWITYGFTRPMPKSESGKKLLTAKDVQRFDLELVECGLTTAEAFEALSSKDKPIKGDLLITKDGSIGRAALVKTDEDFCINQSVAVCWLRSTTMNKRYLELLSNSDFTQRFVKDKAQGMAIQHLSIIDFAKCPVPVPSSTEQNEIVARVEQLFAFADQLETKVASAKSRIDHLTQSILAKAFLGELVPQDPNDEPASVLLARIKAQRAAAPKAKAKRGRKNS